MRIQLKLVLVCSALALIGCDRVVGVSSSSPPVRRADPSLHAAGFLNPNVGVNIEGIADWSRAWMFADLMRQSRHWGTPGTPWDEAATVDSNGWPTQDAGVVIATGGPTATEPNAPYVPEGTYKLVFTGQATVTGVASPATAKNSVYDASTNVTTADLVVPAQCQQIILGFTQTTGGVRNVSLYRPGYYGTGKIFSDEFIAALAPFSTMRFMDYLYTNGNPTVNWADRTTRASSTYASRKGGAWEDVIELANETHKDIWINIPIGATDDYVQNLAQLIKGSLNPDIKVYVEYSNEVWNWSFAQATTNLNAAMADAVAGDTTLTNGQLCTQADFDAGNVSNCNKWWAGLYRIPKRLVQIGQIFGQVFGADAINHQIRPVMATQWGYYAIGEQQMKYMAKYLGAPKNLIYAIAGAPYFAITSADAQLTTLTVDQILADYTDSVSSFFPHFQVGSNDSQGYVVGRPYSGGDFTNASQVALARYYGIKSFAYEGGNHYFQYDASVAAKVQSNFDPRIKDILLSYYSEWFGCGNDLFMHFGLSGGFSKWGSWGLTNNIQDLSGPKYSALKQVAETPLSDFKTCQ